MTNISYIQFESNDGAKTKEDRLTCARKLLDYDFNTSLVMNSDNKKAYDGFYKNQDGEIKTWQIPFKDIEKKAKKGELKYFYTGKRLRIS